MFTSFEYSIETWGDISSFEDQIRKIELDVLKRILKVKTVTGNDLSYVELWRADIIYKRFLI